MFNNDVQCTRTRDQGHRRREEYTGIGSKRHSLQAVELSQRNQAAVQIVSNLPARFFAHAGPAGWLALLLTKAGDVETNPGPTTLNKKVWICDIYHKQIHVRKQISIRCNMIEHWVHLRGAGICQTQYTDTWTCNLHRESRHNTTPPLQAPYQSTPHTPPQPKHRHMSNTPPVPTGLVNPKPNSLIYSPPLHPHRPKPNTYSTNTSHKHVTCTRQNTWTTHTCTHRNHTSPGPHTSTAVTLAPSQHTHMQQYMYHSHHNNRTHNIGYYDNLTNRPRTTTGLLTPSG